MWHEATLPPLQPPANPFASLLTWVASRSKDLQRLRLSTITYGEVRQHLRWCMLTS